MSHLDSYPDAVTNTIRVIAPYKFFGTWVFDDASLGLSREAFVSGIPEMIEDLVKDIPQAEQRFLLFFSDKIFPGYTKVLELYDQEYGGSWYRDPETKRLGWLCPTLFRYFPQAPKQIFLRAEAC